MKKLLMVLLVLSLVFSTAASVMAKGPSSQPKELSIEVSTLVEVVEVGQEVEVNAINQKKGSNYEIDWEVTLSPENAVFHLLEGETDLVALEITSIDSEGNELIELKDHYVSLATFSAETPGTYIVTAYVVMSAGKSHVSWEGNDSTEAIEVIEPEPEVAFVGLTSDTISVTSETNPNGKITGYNVSYIVFANYDDGSKKEVTKGFITMSTNQFSRNVNVVYQDQTYQVVVTR